MAKTTTSKTQKTDVAKKPTVAAAKPAVTEKVETVAEVKTDATTVEKAESQEDSKPAVTEKVETVAEVKTDATTVEKAESQEDSKPAVTEKPEQKDESGLPFKVNSDGTVNVWSKKRAGRSVTGSTGEVITFDDEGFAKVKLEDALHFKDVPGFSFTK